MKVSMVLSHRDLLSPVRRRKLRRRSFIVQATVRISAIVLEA